MVMLFGPRDDLMAAVDEVCADGQRLGEWFTVWNGLQSPAVSLGAAGRSIESDRRVATLTSARALLIRAIGAQVRGEFERADELARDAQSLLDARFGATLDRVLVTFHAAGAALASGDGSVLDALQLEDVAEEHLPLPLRSAYTIARGIHELVAGRVEPARSIFAEGAIDVFPSWRILCFRAQLDLAVGDVDGARRNAEPIGEMTAEVSAPRTSPSPNSSMAECERAGGAAGDTAAGLDLAHRALATASEFELWPAAIDALEAIGVLLVDLDRRRDGARVLAAAQVARERMGYRFRFPHRAAYVAAAHELVVGRDGWADGAALSLPAAVEFAQRMRGERTRPPSGWESLTPTELRVVEQVAAGMTNPQIAEALLMSRSTVKTHLVHVYAKLGIGNRAELAAAAAQEGATMSPNPSKVTMTFLFTDIEGSTRQWEESPEHAPNGSSTTSTCCAPRSSDAAARSSPRWATASPPRFTSVEARRAAAVAAQLAMPVDRARGAHGRSTPARSSGSATTSADGP